MKNENGQLMENIWQFSKIYEKIEKSSQVMNRYNNKIIWEWPSDTHLIDNKITDNYYKWRESGFNAKDPIRYPVGFNGRKNCKGVLMEDFKDFSEALGYVESRKKVYGPVYTEMLIKTKRFQNLKKRLENGENLMICEVDVAFGDSLEYYKEKYNVKDNFIVNNTMEINKETFEIMLNDTKHPCGHGYFFAAALLGIKIT